MTVATWSQELCLSSDIVKTSENDTGLDSSNILCSLLAFKYSNTQTVQLNAICMHHHHHHKHQGLGPLIRSVSTVTAARSNGLPILLLPCGL